MKKNSAWLIAIVIIILLVLGGWALFASIEFYDEVEKSRWSDKARANPYLAAMQFLEHGGIHAVHADNLLKLNNLQGVSTLLVSDTGRVINRHQLQAVLDWLQRGGNLIMATSPSSQQNDLLLQHFGVEVVRPDQDDETQQDEPSISETMKEYNEKIDQGMTPEQIEAERRQQHPTTSIKFEDMKDELEADFNSYSVLRHPALIEDAENPSGMQPVSWSASELGIQMMQFESGRGLVSIVTDPSIWTSSRIDQFDHAYLLWLLISKDGDLAILERRSRDSIWVLLRRHAPEFLIALSLWIGLMLWNQAHRFGRIEAPPAAAQRSLGDYFTVIASYLWHHRADQQLLHPLRQQILRKAGQTLPHFSRAADDADLQAELIGRHTGIAPEQVKTVLRASVSHETSLIGTVRQLQRIEKSL